MDKKYRIGAKELTKWVLSVLLRYGYDMKSAEYITAQLIEANLAGIETHGIKRLPIYIDRLKAGLVDSKAKIRAHWKGNVLLVDAQNAQGQVAVSVAIERMLKKRVSLFRKKATVLVSLIKNSSHFGSAGFFAEKIAKKGYLALVLTNAESCVVPHGGTSPVLGTNPIAFAAPSSNNIVNIDFSTSIVSFGNIFMAQEQGISIPEDWGFDEQGRKTDNPNNIVGLRPMAGHKGFALALMIEILSGVLSGAAFGLDIGNMYKDFSQAQNVGHFVLAINIESLMSLEMFRKKMNSLMLMLRDSGVDVEGEAIYIPGERRENNRKKVLKEGILLEDGVWQELQTLAQETGIPLSASTTVS